MAPAWCWLAVRGVASLAPARAWALACALPLLVLLEVGALPRKAWRGHTELAVELAGEAALDDRALLVVSDVSGEGACVAAFAQADHGRRPARQVLRASKALARSDWVGRGYTTRFEDPAQVADWLERARVAVVVQDLAPLAKQRFAHHDQVAEALALHPERWTRDAPRDLVKDGVEHAGALVVWRRVGPVGPAVDLDAEWLLGRDLPSF